MLNVITKNIPQSGFIEDIYPCARPSILIRCVIPGYLSDSMPSIIVFRFFHAALALPPFHKKWLPTCTYKLYFIALCCLIIYTGMAEKLYWKVYQTLKSRIQDGTYALGSYLPSENELCKIHSITRTTARRALEELQKDGFISREHGKGSRVKERRQTLGLLTVKGFSEAVGDGVRTRFLQRPTLRSWPEPFAFSPEKRERSRYVIYFERLRGVGEIPVMLECNWFPSRGFEELLHTDFVDGSFFKTLSKKYMVEISGSEQELRAQQADEKIAHLLNIALGAPILNISIRFETGQSGFRIYSCLYCNTDKYPIGNIYHHRL